MKIAFYGTKPYDKIWFEPMGKEYGFDIYRGGLQSGNGVYGKGV